MAGTWSLSYIHSEEQRGVAINAGSTRCHFSTFHLKIVYHLSFYHLYFFKYMPSWIYVHQCSWCVLVGWKRAWKKNWNYRQLWSTTWMMGTEPWSSIKSHNVLNHWAIFTAPISLPFNSSGCNPEEWYCPQWVRSSQLNWGGHDSHRQAHRTALSRRCFIEVLFPGDR